MDDSQALEQLGKSGRYRVIERLEPRERYWQGEPTAPRIGLVVDVEATGLDTSRDKIIELGMVAFEYDAVTGMVYRVLHSYGGFEDPGKPLREEIRRLTGIDDAMLAGQRLDDSEVADWFERADLVIAHNAAFDRRMLERRIPASRKANWACTMFDIDWNAEGVSSVKLDYIAFRLGYFFEGHRAVNDAAATLHLLTRHLPGSGKLAMIDLMTHANETSRRFFAIHAPFEKKDVLRERGYRWLPDFTYGDPARPKRGVWSRAVGASAIEAEEHWLAEVVYRERASMYAYSDITAAERYSLRELEAG